MVAAYVKSCPRNVVHLGAAVAEMRNCRMAGIKSSKILISHNGGESAVNLFPAEFTLCSPRSSLSVGLVHV